MPFVLSTKEAVGQSQKIDLSVLAPLRPLIIGPQAVLHRYAQASEKTGILVGTVQFDVDRQYAWPGKEAGSLVDLSYAKVWLDDALLKYHDDAVSQGGVVAPVADYPNHIRSAANVYKTANDVDRSSDFLDRDVTVGDTVFVRGTVDSVVGTLWTTVRGFAYEIIPSEVGAAESDDNNKPDQSASASIEQVDDTPVNDVVAVVDGSNYDSRDDGYINRTYLVTVILGSTGGDATSAVLDVEDVTGSIDDDEGVAPAAFGAPTAIGSKGLTVTWSIDGAASSSVSGYAEQDFVAGQQWLITVSQDFVAPEATSGGTYSGPTDTVLKIEVTRGGAYSAIAKPQISVTSTTGITSSGPHNVTGAAVDVEIGSFTPPVTVQFDSNGLRKGDIYYIACTAESEGAAQTLVLTNNLTAARDTDGGLVDLTQATDLDLRLYIKQQGVQLAETRTYPSLGVNWSADADALTLESGLYLYDSTWTDGGVQQPLPVESAKVYAEYREWVIGLANEVQSVSKLSDVASTLGTVDPDNPIAWAVYKALQNTAGALLTSFRIATASVDTVKAICLDGDPDDTDSWTNALAAAQATEDIYYLVPLTQNAEVHAAVAAHVQAQSDTSVGRFRACLLSPEVADAEAVVDDTKTSDLTTALATLSQDPDTEGDAFTILTVAAGNARFITNGVVPGDTVRYLYTLDNVGQSTYSEFTVDEVVSEDTLKLVDGGSQSVSVAQRVEVWRDLAAADVVTQVTDMAAGFSDSRVVLVWPDVLSSAGVEVPGYFLCAAIAGLAGSVPSHQGMRHVQLQGFDSLTRSTRFLTAGQLETLAAGGVFPVTTDSSGRVYAMAANTTDVSTTESREEMVRRNLDMVRLGLQTEWAEYIGVANITDQLFEAMRVRAINFRDRLRSRCRTQKLGPPVFTLTVNSLSRHETLSDHTVANITVTAPMVHNLTELTVAVG